MRIEDCRVGVKALWVKYVELGLPGSAANPIFTITHVSSDRVDVAWQDVDGLKDSSNWDPCHFVAYEPMQLGEE